MPGQTLAVAWRRAQVIFSDSPPPWCPHTADLASLPVWSHRQGPGGLTRPTLLAPWSLPWQGLHPTALIISVKSFSCPDSFLPLTLSGSGALQSMSWERLPASHETKNVRILKVQGTLSPCLLPLGTASLLGHCHSPALPCLPVLSSSTAIPV